MNLFNRIVALLFHVLFCCFLSCRVCHGGNSDVYCLKTLKDSLQDPWSHLKSSWNFTNQTEGFICKFTGISCWHDDENRVIGIDLSDMGLKGKFPKGLENCSSLIGLDLSSNQLSGPIPSNIGQLVHFLTSFDLSSNNFSGEIPLSLSNCSFLNVLKLDNNRLTGQIPPLLRNLDRLKNFTVTNNLLSGQIPSFNTTFPRENYANNRGLCGAPFEACTGHYRKLHTTVIIGLAVAGLIVASLIVGGVVFFYSSMVVKKKKEEDLEGNKWAKSIKRTKGIKVIFLMFCLKKKPKEKPPTYQFMGDIKRVSYYDLHKATNGFSLENLIGMGSYGSVYKGILQQDECPIAVKVLNLTKPRASKSFIAECEALREIRHRNLLKILTVCSSVDSNGNDFRALVLKFMPNGSLERWLHTSSDGKDVPKSLNLYQRLDIAIDVASALDYLQNECERPIVHCDLKSSNVFLDEDMTSHVGDFGLAKFLSKSTSSSNKNESNSIAIRGTIGYIPPEYGMGARVSAHGDVYSYGILLLEIFTGKRPTDHMFKEGLTLHDFSKTALPQQVMDIIDTRLLEENTQTEVSSNPVNGTIDCLSRILRIGVACSKELMIERMDIKDVLKELHSIKETLSVGTQQ